MKELDNVVLAPDQQASDKVKNNNIENIKQILGVKKLYKPKSLPGVYVLHFEKDNIIYIYRSK